MVYNLDGSLTVFWDAAHKLLNIFSSLQFFNKEFVLSAAAQAGLTVPTLYSPRQSNTLSKLQKLSKLAIKTGVTEQK